MIKRRKQNKEIYVADGVKGGKQLQSKLCPWCVCFCLHTLDQNVLVMIEVITLLGSVLDTVFKWAGVGIKDHM